MKFTPKQFSDATGISVELGKKILDILDKKKLGPEDLGQVIWRLRDIVIKRDLGVLLEKLKTNEIEATIDQLILERAMYEMRCPQDVRCAETAEQLMLAFGHLGKPETAWFFADIPEEEGRKYKAGDMVTIQIFRVGKWEHQEYGTVEVTEDTIKDVVKNFASRARGVDLCVDENHEPDHKALGWYKEVYAEDENKTCFAKIELTKKGADLLNEGAYKYFSPEICFYKVDEETGKQMSNLLIGGAFTNRPFFKGMKSLMGSEGAAASGQRSEASGAGQSAYFFSQNSTMHKLLMRMDSVLTKGQFTSTEKADLEQLYSEIAESDRTAELNTKFAELLANFEEGGDDTSKVTPAAEVEETEEGKGDDTTDTTEGEKPEGVEGEVKANEDGTATVDKTFMENVKGMKKKLSEMEFAETIRTCEAQVKALCFSEKRPTNVILPKHVTKVSRFAAGLSEPMRKEFFELIGAFKAVPAGVKGHGGDAAAVDFNDPKTLPAEDEKVAYFMETLKQDLPTAQKSAADFYKALASKK